MEKLQFGPHKTKCDWCGCEERCAVTHYGTSHYNRLICLECAMSINENDALLNGGFDTEHRAFDLNNSVIRFKEVE